VSRKQHASNEIALELVVQGECEEIRASYLYIGMDSEWKPLIIKISSFNISRRGFIA
jgi:hypothetical protein